MTIERGGGRGSVWPAWIVAVILAAGLVFGFDLYRSLQAPVTSGASAVRAEVVTGAAVMRHAGVAVTHAADHMTLTPPATAAPAEAGARVKVDDGVVDFHFAQGKAELAEGADEALAVIVKGVAVGKKAVISAYRKAAGNPHESDQLALERVQAVRAALVALGIGADKLVVRDIAETIAAGAGGSSERIEVTLEK